jgi:hypothetical protein
VRRDEEVGLVVPDEGGNQHAISMQSEVICAALGVERKTLAWSYWRLSIMRNMQSACNQHAIRGRTGG